LFIVLFWEDVALLFRVFTNLGAGPVVIRSFTKLLIKSEL